MPNNSERIEVLSSIQRRRRYSLDEKMTVLAEASQPGMSIS
jgi:transposase-like protein